jgi:membrane protein required for colicin V production
VTYMDGVALVILALSGLFAVVRGFVREVLGIFAWAGAAVLALLLYPDLMPAAKSLIPVKGAVEPAAIAAVFLVSLIILSLISAWIGGLVQNSALSGLDRTLGLAFGLVRGAFVVILLYIGLSMFVEQPDWPAAVSQARLLPYAYDGAVWLTGMLPPNYRPRVDKLPANAAPPATALMQAPIAGSATSTTTTSTSQ